LNRTLVFSFPARYDSQMSRQIRFELDVDAPADVVWEVVSNVSRYAEWNPFVIRASSTCEVGAPIRMKVRLFTSFAQSQTEEITEFIAPERICWGLTGGGSAALRSRRCQVVSPDGPSRSRYISEFQLSGWFAPVVMGLMGRRLEAGFRGMSDAVKARAEQLYRTRG
jgi:uncharacterized protein YndB with AHSA1/START domain